MYCRIIKHSKTPLTRKLALLGIYHAEQKRLSKTKQNKKLAVRSGGRTSSNDSTSAVGFALASRSSGAKLPPDDLVAPT